MNANQNNHKMQDAVFLALEFQYYPRAFDQVCLDILVVNILMED
jgi:hypothetical protein